MTLPKKVTSGKVPGVLLQVRRSFGVDRMYDVMEELNVFLADVNISAQVLFINSKDEVFDILQQLRSKGIRENYTTNQQKLINNLNTLKRKIFLLLYRSKTEI